MFIRQVIAGLILIVLVAFILSIQPRGITGFSTYNETAGNETENLTNQTVVDIPILNPMAGACVDLSNSSTWAGKLYNISDNSFLIIDNVTLCTSEFSTNVTFPVFIFNGSFILDCNGSTITGNGLSTAVLSTKNGSVVRNCIFENFGLGANVLSTNAAASPITVWNWTWDVSSSQDSITSLAVDQEGYYILGGWDQIPGNLEWRVAKMDRNGNLLWNWSWDISAGSDDLVFTAVDQDGNYVFAGDDSITTPDWRVVKLSNDGYMLWNWSSNFSASLGQVLGIAVDQDGNYIVVGDENSVGNKQLRAVKLNGSSGEEIWNWSQDPSGATDKIHAIAVDQKNNYIFAGYDANEWRVVKVDSSGNTIWNWTWDVSGGSDVCYSIAINNAGNYVLGGVANTLWATAEITPNGSFVWNRTIDFGGGQTGRVDSIAVDQDGNYILSGYNIAGFPILRLVKLDRNGNILWNWTQIPAMGDNWALSVAVDQEGYYVVGGRDDIPGLFQSEWRVVKLSEPRVQMSGVVFENVSFYKQNMSTYVALQNVSANLTNFTIGSSALTGKIVYPRLVNVSGTLATTWNLLLNSSFVSLNSSNTLASAFNASANITLSGASKYGFNVFKLNGFPQSRNAILAAGSKVSTYTAVRGLRAIFSTFRAFSGYAITPRPKPATPGGGGSSSGSASSSTSTSTQSQATTTELPAPMPSFPEKVEAPKVHVEQPSKVTMPPPEPVSAPVEYIPPTKQTNNSEGILKATFYLLCAGALILLGFMVHRAHKGPRENRAS
ncbi:hypothetical protein KY329_02420 [Candidatus Woesearchaeota archaeon]|nr:hypothetical protein [Candidatus Woesearchaeota archaeon]